MGQSNFGNSNLSKCKARWYFKKKLTRIMVINSVILVHNFFECIRLLIYVGCCWLCVIIIWISWLGIRGIVIVICRLFKSIVSLFHIWIVIIIRSLLKRNILNFLLRVWLNIIILRSSKSTLHKSILGIIKNRCCLNFGSLDIIIGCISQCIIWIN